MTPSLFKRNLDSEISIIVRKVKAKTYKFTTYKEKLISKGCGKIPRQLSIPTVRDKLVLRALHDILIDAFPKSKIPRPQNIIEQVKQALCKVDNSYSFVRIDVKNYYPSIRHKPLLKKIKTEVKSKKLMLLIKCAMSTGTGIPKETNKKGVPQGLSISNILASIYLEDIDTQFNSISEANTDFFYFRYVDDILLIVKNSETNKWFDEVRASLKCLGLKVHKLQKGNVGKTAVVTVKNNVDYLGYALSNSEISVRSSSFKRMMENIMKVLTKGKHRYGPSNASAKITMARLSLKITGCIYNGKRLGWVHFFSQVTNTSQLMRLDNFVKKQVSLSKLEIGDLPSFNKAHLEMNYNFKASKYIPNFDEFTKDEKEALIANFSNEKLSNIQMWEKEKIDITFKKIADRETRGLEEDLPGFS